MNKPMTSKAKPTDAPSEAVPDSEIIEVMMGATAALMRMYSRGIGSRRDVAARAISALRSHFHITIKRKE